jgi:hypothetical protein
MGPGSALPGSAPVFVPAILIPAHLFTASGCFSVSRQVGETKCRTAE